MCAYVCVCDLCLSIAVIRNKGNMKCMNGGYRVSPTLPSFFPPLSLSVCVLKRKGANKVDSTCSSKTVLHRALVTTANDDENKQRHQRGKASLIAFYSLCLSLCLHMPVRMTFTVFSPLLSLLPPFLLSHARTAETRNWPHTHSLSHVPPPLSSQLSSFAVFVF